MAAGDAVHLLQTPQLLVAHCDFRDVIKYSFMSSITLERQYLFWTGGVYEHPVLSRTNASHNQGDCSRKKESWFSWWPFDFFPQEKPKFHFLNLGILFLNYVQAKQCLRGQSQ